jgi:septin family protein
MLRGPNDHHLDGDELKSGLGAAEEARIRAMTGGDNAGDSPTVAALRKQSESLAKRATRLSLAEQELAKDRAEAAADLEKRQADLELKAREIEARERELLAGAGAGARR